MMVTPSLHLAVAAGKRHVRQSCVRMLLNQKHDKIPSGCEVYVTDLLNMTSLMEHTPTTSHRGMARPDPSLDRLSSSRWQRDT